MVYRWGVRLLAIAATFVVGCSSFEGPAPDVWPQATQSEHIVEAAETSATVRPETREKAETPSPAQAERQRHELTADDGHTLVLWEKSAAAPRGAILLLHGRTWSSLPDFDLQVAGEQRSTMDALVAEGYATYALDLRGYGETARDKTGWNTPNRAAADLAVALKWIADRGEHTPAVLGWSLGSLTAQQVAQQHPQLVSALVLYGYPRGVKHRYRTKVPASASPPRRKTTANAAAADFIAPGQISKVGADAFVQSALRSDPVRADWRAMGQWSVLDPAKVKVPTLLIHGELDPYARPNRQAKVFAALGHADRTWVIVAGGDHAAHLEDTGPRFIHAVVSFLQRPK